MSLSYRNGAPVSPLDVVRVLFQGSPLEFDFYTEADTRENLARAFVKLKLPDAKTIASRSPAAAIGLVQDAIFEQLAPLFRNVYDDAAPKAARADERKAVVGLLREMADGEFAEYPQASAALLKAAVLLMESKG